MSRSIYKAHLSRHHPREGGRRDELAERVREWAQGMGCSASTLPPQEDMKALLGGGMSGVWEHIVGHVRSPRSAESIRGNVLVHSRGTDFGSHGDESEKVELLEQRVQLSREMSSLRLAVTQLERDMTRLRGDVSDMDASNRLVQSDMSEMGRKVALLAEHSQQCRESVRILNEFTRRIRQRMELFRHVPKETSYFARSGGTVSTSGEGDRIITLESACTREVRGSCQGIEQLVCLMDRGQRVDQQRLETVRQHTWSKVEELLSRYPPGEILASLVEVTEGGATEIHNHTANIDLRKDAEQLKYHYDQQGGVEDAVGKPDLLHSVEEHLLEAQLSHVRKSLQSEKAQEGTKVAQGRLQEVKGQAEELLLRQYKDDAEGMELARMVFHLDLEQAGCVSALATLSSICAELNSARDQQRAALEQLQLKHKRIQEFTEIAESKQGEIKSLVKHNSAARDRLRKQRTEVELYLRQNVCAHEGRLVLETTGLVDGVRHEVHLFSTLSLARMMKTPGDHGIPVCELSTNRLAPVQPSGYPSWNSILWSLGLQRNSAPEKVLARASKLLQKVEELTREVGERERVVSEIREGGCVDRQQAEELLAAAQRDEERHLKELTPAVTQCLSQASRGLAYCGTVQSTLSEWWDQPAQYAVPWVSYDGMNVAEWMQQWHVLTTKLTQLSSSASGAKK